MGTEMKEKLTDLEKALADFIRHTDLGFAKVENALIEQKRSMEDFKDEMKDFKDEMKDFKDEMKTYKVESMRQIDYLNLKWGELTNRLGTFAEDFAAPNIPTIARNYFNCDEEPDDFMVRRKRTLPGSKEKRKEFDIIAVYPEIVFFCEAKFTLRAKDIDDFLENISVFFDYFPEYGTRKIIPILTSMSIDESNLNKCTSDGIYVMIPKGDTMDLVNYNQILQF